MANPPSLTPEQRQRALEKAAAARRQRAEVKDKLKIGSLTSRRAVRRKPTAGTRAGDMLAKLKVVSVLESLPGVGKVNATRLMRGSTSPTAAVSAAWARSSASGCSASPTTSSTAASLLNDQRKRDGGHRHSRRASCSSSPARPGPGKGTVGRLLRERDPALALVGVVDDAAPPARRDRGRRLPLRHPRGVRAAARRRRLPRVVRGLRRPQGHAPAVRRRRARGRPRRDARGRRAGRARGPRGASRTRCSCSSRRRPGRSSAAGSRPGAAEDARGDRAPPGPGRRRGGARRRSEFDAVVVNDDVDRAAAERRCYPGGPPQRPLAEPADAVPSCSRAPRSTRWPSAARR